MKKLILILLLLFIQNVNAFWNETRKGANVFNREIPQEDIKAAKEYGMAFIRLAPDKFPSKQRDFLIGNADQYVALDAQDLATLKKVLDMYAEEKLPVVITMLSLPGSRWKQNNQDIDDLRLWNSPEYQRQAAKFWKDLAVELKNHPAIVGYDILNEPHPEKLKITDKEVQQKLFDFYRLVITSIRTVDKNTPIILDSSMYADPKTFEYFKIQQDSNIIYSFHMYEPFEYTNHKMNNGKYSYPGKIGNTYWDKTSLNAYVQHVVEFQKINHIPSNRILVGEFGGYRTSPGLNEYFKDLVCIFDENHWHHAFYAFREDTWDGMDYELGDKKLSWSYWQAIEKNEKPVLMRDKNAPIFKVLVEGL